MRSCIRDGLVFRLNDNDKTAEVIGVSETERRVYLSIPSMLILGEDLFDVDSICSYAFLKNTSSTMITIPDSIRYIATNAFAHSGFSCIVCKLLCQPDGWDRLWNPDGVQVIWQFGGVRRVINGFDVAKCLDEHGHSYAVITGYSGNESYLIIPSSIVIKGFDYSFFDSNQRRKSGCHNDRRRSF